MLKLDFSGGSDAPFNVLCLGAHSDDIEIGCGGTIWKLQEMYPNTAFYWVVFGCEAPQREAEALESANLFLKEAASKTVITKKFRNSFFPYFGDQIKESFEEIKKLPSPDLILTHYRNDLHQDHRVVSELTWNAFRNHWILEYEIPKYDGDLGTPNVFVPLEKALVQKKIDHIQSVFKSQRSKEWFDEQTFSALPRLRGMESCAKEKYAEAFYCRKLVLA